MVSEDQSEDTPSTTINPTQGDKKPDTSPGQSYAGADKRLGISNRESGTVRPPNQSTRASNNLTVQSTVFELVDRYEKTLKESGSADIKAFLPKDPEARLDVLGEILQVDIEVRFRKGERNASCIDYLDQFPELTGESDILLGLLSREMAVKQRGHVDVDLDVELYQARLPALASTIHAMAVKHGFRSPEIKGYNRLIKIAAGGMGVIFSARDASFGRDVAIKVMKEGMSSAAFDREAHIMANLPHPCIPPIHAKGTLADGRPYFVMKLIHGKTLKERLDQRSQSEESRTIAELSTGQGDLLGIFENMCQAVGYAHSQGVIHRDIKPANIMVGSFGEVQVMDWGLAKTIEPVKFLPESNSEAKGTGKTTLLNYPEAEMITQPGVVKGTAPYMSPEQARGEPADERSDVFSLGGILLEMLTGEPPFNAKTHIEAVDLAAKADLSHAFRFLDRCEANPDLVRLCKWSLAADPAHRPSDAKALALAMVQYRVKLEDQANEWNSVNEFNKSGHKPMFGFFASGLPANGPLMVIGIVSLTSLCWIALYFCFKL